MIPRIEKDKSVTPDFKHHGRQETQRLRGGPTLLLSRSAKLHGVVAFGRSFGRCALKSHLTKWERRKIQMIRHLEAEEEDKEDAHDNGVGEDVEGQYCSPFL